MDKADQRDFDSHYEYWDKIKGAKHKFYESPEKRAFIDITEYQDKLGGEMNQYYDYDYCCGELEKIGRNIRNVINEDLPVALDDVSVMRILGDLDIMECPFCKVSTEETYERIRIQWNGRHPTANLHFNIKRREG